MARRDAPQHGRVVAGAGHLRGEPTDGERLHVAQPVVSRQIRALEDDLNSQVEVLHDGRVDVSYVRLPIDQTGLKLVALFSEPRLVALPVDHRLAGKRTVSVTDLADEHLLQDPAAVPEWRANAGARDRRADRRPIATMRTVEEKLEHVASGHGIVILPESTTTFYRRPDVACIPIHDISPNQVSLAWEAARRSRLVHEFADLAQRHQPTADRPS